MSVPKGYVCRDAYSSTSVEMLRVLIKTSESPRVIDRARQELIRRGEKK
jgi:hypothetical protein